MAIQLDNAKLEEIKNDKSFFTKIKGVVTPALAAVMLVSSLGMSGQAVANTSDTQNLNPSQAASQLNCKYDSDGNVLVSPLTNPRIQNAIRTLCEAPQNELISQENAEISNLQYEVEAFRGSFTLSHQESIIELGAFLTKDNPDGQKNFTDMYNAVEKGYYDEVNSNPSLNQHNYSMGQYALDKVDSTEIASNPEFTSFKDLPNYQTNAAHTHFTYVSKLDGLDRTKAVLDGMSIAEMKGMTEVKYQEEFIELSQQGFANKMFRDGGKWDNNISDMSFDFSHLSKSYNDNLTSTYKNSSPEQISKAENAPRMEVEFRDIALKSETRDMKIDSELRSLQLETETRSLDLEPTVRKAPEFKTTVRTFKFQ